MNCADSHEKLVLAAYGELPDDQSPALTLHLTGCAECQEEQQQLQALKTLAAARPVLEPDANLVARSRTRLEESLDAIPPKQWYDRLADWMTRTAAGLQAAPAAACLLLVAGAGIGSMGGYWFAARPGGNLAGNAGGGVVTVSGRAGLGQAGTGQAGTGQAGMGGEAAGPKTTGTEAGPVVMTAAANPFAAGEVANISAVVRQPNSKLVEVSYNQVEPRRVQGTVEDPAIRQLLMLASENGTSSTVRDNSVELLAAECRSGKGCLGSGAQGGGSGGEIGAEIKDALMVALRYDRSTQVRQKALSGLQPFLADDMRVRDAVLEALMNDPDARVRSAAISMLQPVEADTSVRQVLSTVALSDQNSNIRNASRVVLRRVSEIQ